MYTTFESILERALAPSTGVNLRLNNNIDIAEFTRDLFCFIKARRNPPLGGRYIEFLQQLFGLVFVNVHPQGAAVSSPPPLGSEGKLQYPAEDKSAKIFLPRIGLPLENQSHYGCAMNTLIKLTSLVCALLVTVTLSVFAGTSPQEKAFTDKYKTAFEGKDTATLESFLYTQGAAPAILGFYKMMQSGEAGEKISKIDLVNLTPEDAKKAAAPQDSPTGGKVCLTLKPVTKIEKKDANGSSTSTSENFIGQKDGKFVIPVPGPCK